jgi:hypothetical protein
LVRSDGVIENEEGSKRPQSAIFSDHKADGAMSVFLEDEIVAQGRQPEELFQAFDPSYEICWHYAEEYFSLGQRIERSKDEIFPGHANVTDRGGKRPAAKRSKLALSARWLERPEETS